MKLLPTLSQPLPEPVAALTRAPAEPREAYHRARLPAVYLHIPFCRAICPYCDFNTYARQEHLVERYVDSMLAELTAWRGLVAAAGRRTDLPVPSIYLGGGTPSLLPAEAVARLVAAAHGFGRPSTETEVTMEANPGSVDEAYFRAVRDAGVNRISLGAQSFQPHGLKRLGRGHGVGGTEAAVAAARAAGIDNLSLDLMFGWPEQTLAEWAADLEHALALRPDHFSLYSLQIEPGTPFARLAERGRLPVPDDDLLADMYEQAETRLAEAGFRHYEISSWARRSTPGEPPRDRRSRHNLVYWHNDEYVGLGAGAHGFALGHRWVETRLPARYIARLAAGERVAETVETIDAAREISDTLIMGLRLDDGISVDGFERRFGRSLDRLFGREIAELQANGWLQAVDGRVRLAPPGRFVANEVFRHFLDPRLPADAD